MKRVYAFKKLSDLVADDIFTFELKPSNTEYWVFVKKEKRIVIAKTGSLIKKFLDDEIVIMTERP